MLSPRQVITTLVDPGNWIRLGADLVKASPTLIPIYFVIMGACKAFIGASEVKPNAGALLQVMAFCLTIEIHLLYQFIRARK